MPTQTRLPELSSSSGSVSNPSSSEGFREQELRAQVRAEGHRDSGHQTGSAPHSLPLEVDIKGGVWPVCGQVDVGKCA